MAPIDYNERIPNNVSLAENRRLLRALEDWQPKFLEWWHDMGPEGFQSKDVYLRTAVSVDAKGWAQFGYVKMPEYRWGIFLAEPEADRRINFGDHQGQPAWPDVPGEYRATLRRLIVTQGDTEPASVEQQRHLGPHLSVALRPAQPLPGQRGGGTAPLGDGVPARRALRPRRARGVGGAPAAALGRPRQAADPGRLQREDPGLAVVLHVLLLHGSRRQVPAREPRGERLRSALPHLPLHAHRGSASHVRGGERGGAHRPARLRAHARAQDRRRAEARGASTCRRCRSTSTSTARSRSTCSAPRSRPTRRTSTPRGSRGASRRPRSTTITA